MPKIVRFKKMHGAYQVGDSAEFYDATAEALVKSGTAEIVSQPKAPKPDPVVDAMPPTRKGAEVPVKKAD